MRVTLQLLRSKASRPLSSVQFLDLSNLEILSIERLGSCPRVKHLILHGNNLQSVSNLDCCHQLWNLDVSNNDIRCLVGLSRFMALGSLVLANNDLTWSELAKIKHLHILQLTLLGNPRLERDPFYRIHVIDCLPHVWMLDGKLITSTERLQVEHFFQASSLSSHPVRHKLPKDRFIPSSLKNINVTGIYGDKATHLLRRFQADATINSETDKRRMMYLAYNLQQDIFLLKRSTKKVLPALKFHATFMETILTARPKCLEQCNMLLLLLAASLEFSLPAHLMKATLEASKLDRIGEVNTMDLFLLPRDVRCHVITILMNAVKVDKDSGLDGGLYGTLYHCLDHSVSELYRIRYRCQPVPARSLMASQYKDYKCLLASEVVQLLCIVPAFFQYLDKDEGVKGLLMAAAKNSKITDEILVVGKTAKSSGATVKEICERVAGFIVEKVEVQMENIVNKKVRLFGADKVFSETRALPKKRPNSVVLADYHMTGKRPPEKESPKLHPPPYHGPLDTTVFPHLGDRVLLGPQTVAKVVALPQPFLALVQMDTVPDVNGAMVTCVKKADFHYTYVDMTHFQWRFTTGIWKPKGTIGDRITIQRLGTRWQELEEAGCLPYESEVFSRPNSPVSPRHELGMIKKRTPNQETGTTMKHTYAVRPRPMSAVLKEKLKLNLNIDQSKRPKSAMVKRSRPESPDQSDDDQEHFLDTLIEKSRLTEESDGQIDVPQVKISPSADVTLDTIEDASCQVKAAPQNTEDKAYVKTDRDPRLPSPSPEECLSDFDEIVTISKDPLPKDFSDENCAINPCSSLESNLDELRSLRTQNKVAAMRRETVGGTIDEERVFSPRPQQVAISLPRVEQSESLNTSKDESFSAVESEGCHDQRYSSRPMSVVLPGQDSRVMVNVLESRPYSAVEAYKFVVAHPAKGYQSCQTSLPHKSYIRRKSAPASRWRQPVHLSQTQQAFSRPSTAMYRSLSPEPKDTKQGQFHVLKTDNWLANGRDVYKEMQDKRPKSGHAPGWKEELLRSRRSRPHSKTTCPVTPQTSRDWHNNSAWIPLTLAHNDFLQEGSPRDSLQLPELPSLSDYLGSARETQHYL
ncbi:uncharacterized protein LOC135470042 [Liolophura sinensis]|uniref:uncharacterized protein LOC135470042 n=1 Tax=Liolophura sinensis TaxID=3198878 RepID=UPI003158565C